jgi:protein phosphatase
LKGLGRRRTRTQRRNCGLSSWWRQFWGGDAAGARKGRAPEAEHEITAEYSTPSAISLAAGGHSLRVGVVTTTGNVREHNEDNFFVPGMSAAEQASRKSGSSDSGAAATPAAESSRDPYINGPPGLFLVADGMGGQLAGEKASEMAVDIIPSELRRRLGGSEDDKAILRAIRDGVAEANQEILAQSHLVTEYANMGTTVVLLLFRGDRAFVAGIGDSRAYRLREDQLERLTKDHSLADALVGAGTIRPDEAENHKFKNVLYLYLGSKDARDGPEEIRSLDVRPGDRFLLASDGLTGVVRDDVIAQLLRDIDDPQRAAQILVNRALENRSKDNITCVVIHVDGPGSAQ